jgi:hypothetical protein
MVHTASNLSGVFMINRLREFQQYEISSMPQGLLDPDEMGELAFSQDYEEYLDSVMVTLKTSADEFKAKLGLWPNDAHGSPMYKQYLAWVIGARIVIEELFELKCTMRDARKKKENSAGNDPRV